MKRLTICFSLLALFEVITHHPIGVKFHEPGFEKSYVLKYGVSFGGKENKDKRYYQSVDPPDESQTVVTTAMKQNTEY